MIVEIKWQIFKNTKPYSHIFKWDGQTNVLKSLHKNDVNRLPIKSCCFWKMAAYLDIQKPSINSIHLEITRHESAIQ